MNFIDKLNAVWRRNRSMVCVGLDPDLTKLPELLRHQTMPIFEFNRAIIDATAPYVCAYKPQAAYYAGQDADDQLKMTIDYLHERYPDIPVILDVKRGDIGSTAAQYALEAFERYRADAVTVNPYMGTDALKPFLDYADRGVIILCRTSNPSSCELQELIYEGQTIYEHVAVLARDKWNYNGNALLVVGATYPEELGRIRRLCPEMPFLVPGVGAQGGDVEKVVANGTTPDGFGLIINSSRGIIYADKGENFAPAAGEAARILRDLINDFKK
ncbi:orotidine-5'-phosphate decarboxylase [Victivallis sp. Marseille-Q1083]|uniref:orotidine-5'-phosphate decarboxylase n=1 Tax=Victivallis sp. Marseille-Q1083 TaxID=2717288 RepID=UPI00158EFDDE|nr:orotidine-5'-phosphate decarboxylase [Victivallis sp. Marseille-Q1083]